MESSLQNWTQALILVQPNGSVWGVLVLNITRSISISWRIEWCESYPTLLLLLFHWAKDKDWSVISFNPSSELKGWFQSSGQSALPLAQMPWKEKGVFFVSFTTHKSLHMDGGAHSPWLPTGNAGRFVSYASLWKAGQEVMNVGQNAEESQNTSNPCISTSMQNQIWGISRVEPPYSRGLALFYKSCNGLRITFQKPARN